MSSDIGQLPRTLQLPGSVFRGTAVDDAISRSSSSQYRLLPIQDFDPPSQAESNFIDGSDVLFSLYNQKAAEHDQKLAENWREDAQGIMLLSGLISATVGGFLSQSYFASQTTSQDVSAFYLGQLYKLQASSSNASSDAQQPPPSPPTPASPSTATNALWFASLVLSLASAVFATLVQEWVRRYLLLTQPRYSPHRRARIRACMMQEGSLVELQRTVHSLHTFLHLSIFSFMLGLVMLTSNGGLLIVVAVDLYIALPLILYLKYSMMPYFYPQSLYSTPLSGFLLSLKAIPRLALSLFRLITCRGGFDEGPQGLNHASEGGWLTLDYAILEVEKLAETCSSTLDIGAMSWLLNSLGQDQELEQFLAGVPGFYRSKRVGDPPQVLRALNTNRLPKALVSFMDRSLSSELLSDNTRQKRTRVSLKAMVTDTYLLQRTFYHALSSVDSAVFKCIDFVLLAHGCTKDEDPEIRFLAKCIVAVAINRLEDRTSDDRWSDIFQRGLNWPPSRLVQLGGQRESVKLRNLVHIARELNSAHPDYDDPSARTTIHNTLGAVRQLRVEGACHEVQREFCEFWNQLVASTRDLGRDPVIRSNAMRILSLTRTVYIPLHEGTRSRCFSFSAAGADDLDSPPQKAAAPYPVCAISTHQLALGAAPEGSVVAHGSWED